jgi:large-conductance mechanosensitive channel
MEYVDNMFRFVVDNNIIGSISGVTLGFVISTAVKSLVSDIMMPTVYKVLYFILSLTPMRNTHVLNRFFEVTELHLDKFIKELVNLFLIMVCAYFFFINVLSKYIANKNNARESPVPAPPLNYPLTTLTTSIPQPFPSNAHALAQLTGSDQVFQVPMYPGLRVRAMSKYRDDGTAAAVSSDDAE